MTGCLSLSGLSEIKERELGEVVGELLYYDLGDSTLDTKFPWLRTGLTCFGLSIVYFIDVIISLLLFTSCSNLLLKV